MGLRIPAKRSFSMNPSISETRRGFNYSAASSMYIRRAPWYLIQIQRPISPRSGLSGAPTREPRPILINIAISIEAPINHPRTDHPRMLPLAVVLNIHRLLVGRRSIRRRFASSRPKERRNTPLARRCTIKDTCLAIGNNWTEQVDRRWGGRGRGARFLAVVLDTVRPESLPVLKL